MSATARLLVCWLGLQASALPFALADWPQFLGPNRDGVSSEKAALATELPEDGLPRVWTHHVGDGFAGPVVRGSRCLIFHRQDSRAVLESLDAKTGERQWVFEYETDYNDQFGFDPGPRSCPTISGDRVLIHGAEGMLHAVNLEDGKLLWKRDLAREFESPSGFFGRCSSPLVAEGLVMLDVGGRHQNKPANLVAFDLATGDLKWATGEGEADYGSPMLLRPKGTTPLALFFVRDGFVGVDLKKGNIRFQEPFRSTINASVNAASPLVVGERFFLSSCYGVGAGLWEWGEEEALHNHYKRENAMDCHFATPVHHAGHLYGFHGRQESGQEFRCVKLHDASVAWRESMRPGSVIIADGKLLILSEQGELLVAEATPDEWQLHYRAQVTGAETRALPALSQGHFYARDKRRLVCVRLSQP